jgi:uncharacterized protein YoxC
MSNSRNTPGDTAFNSKNIMLWLQWALFKNQGEASFDNLSGLNITSEIKKLLLPDLMIIAQLNHIDPEALQKILGETIPALETQYKLIEANKNKIKSPEHKGVVDSNLRSQLKTLEDIKETCKKLDTDIQILTEHRKETMPNRAKPNAQETHQTQDFLTQSNQLVEIFNTANESLHEIPKKLETLSRTTSTGLSDIDQEEFQQKLRSLRSG